jgi:hypothetical protein
MSNPLVNTPMETWSKAWVVYCDGASFSGNANDPMVATPVPMPGQPQQENRTLYFRGQRILDAVIDELKARGMATASTAVLAGCSAGGLGAIVQCDRFASSLPAVKDARCIGDAGVFLDATSVTTFPPKGSSVMRMQFSNVVRMQNASLSPACTASTANTFPAACFFPQYVLPSLKTPTFIRNSMYNYGEWEVLPQVWENSHNFSSGGWRNPYDAENGTCVWECGRSANKTANNLPHTPDGCNAANKGVMRRFQEEFSAAVAPAMDPATAHGAVIDACATCHCQGLWSPVVVTSTN